METIILIISLTALIIGSYTDIKKREVPDLVNYGIIFLGIGVSIIFSIINHNVSFFFNSLFGFFFMFLFGALMFYSGQWGGGDSKMLMGLGALLGLEISIKTWFTNIPDNIPFLFKFIALVLVVGGVYGLVWGIYIGMKHKKKFFERVEEKLYAPIMSRIKLLLIILALVGILYSFTLEFKLRMFMYLLILLMLVTFYLIVFIKIIEEVGMVKEVPPEKLTEGDWINKDIVVKNKLIAGPKDLGISKEQIEKLKKLKIKKVEIKEGMPFVPAFLIAFVILIVFFLT